jgi:hypothetical protein
MPPEEGVRRPRRERPRDDDDEFELTEDDEEELDRQITRIRRKKRRRRRKPPREMPALLLAMAFVGIIWGGVAMILGIAQFIEGIYYIPKTIGNLRLLAILACVLGFLQFISGTGLVTGGIGLLLHRAWGILPVVYGSVALAALASIRLVIECSILFYYIQKIGPYQVVQIFGVLLATAICAFLFRVHQNDDVHKALD